MAACRYGNFLLVFNLISSWTLEEQFHTTHTYVLSSIYTSDKQYPRDLKLDRRYCIFTLSAHWKMRGSFFTNRQKDYLLHVSFSKTERKRVSIDFTELSEWLLLVLLSHIDFCLGCCAVFIVIAIECHLVTNFIQFKIKEQRTCFCSDI